MEIGSRQEEESLSSGRVSSGEGTGCETGSPVSTPVPIDEDSGTGDGSIAPERVTSDGIVLCLGGIAGELGGAVFLRDFCSLHVDHDCGMELQAESIAVRGSSDEEERVNHQLELRVLEELLRLNDFAILRVSTTSAETKEVKESRIALTVIAALVPQTILKCEGFSDEWRDKDPDLGPLRERLLLGVK